MGEFQQRHWHTMIQLLSDYIEEKVDLGTLIRSLEATLHASELKDEALKKQFYDHWGTFEIEFAAEQEMGAPIDEDRLRSAAISMREFLKRALPDVLAYDPKDRP